MEFTWLVIGGIISLVVSVLSGLAISRVNQQKASADQQNMRVDELRQAVTSLQNTSVSDLHVRRVVKEEFMPLAITLAELVKSMHNIEVILAEEKGYKAARTAIFQSPNHPV